MSDDLREIRLAKLNQLRAMGINPFDNTFRPNLDLYEVEGRYKDWARNDLEEPNGYFTHQVAGRIVFARHMGKISFIKIADHTGILQIVLKVDLIGQGLYDFVKDYVDLGDIIGVSGKVMRTQKGELSIAATSIKILTKSLKPLPEKWHGLVDTEARYRQRYLDLISNFQSRDVFVRRSIILKAIRDALNDDGFMEVETPMLHPIAGGAAAKPFVTHHNTLDRDLFLRIAPELYLKRVIVGGFNKVFEINRNFRNEGMDTKHNPEFTTLELYKAYSNYNDLMDLTENLIEYLAGDVCKINSVEWNGNTINLIRSFERISMINAISKYSDLSPEDCRNFESARNALRNQHGIDPAEMTHGKVVLSLFETIVEDKLIQPTFIYDFPFEVSPLARRKDSDPWLVDRFELFVGGCEIANGFSELNDPIDQRARFNEQLKAKELGDEEAHEMDEDFIQALETGMPPTAGLGIGIDRLVMLLTGSSSIRDVVLFPTMR